MWKLALSLLWSLESAVTVIFSFFHMIVCCTQRILLTPLSVSPLSINWTHDCTQHLALCFRRVVRCSQSADTVSQIIKAWTLSSNVCEWRLLSGCSSVSGQSIGLQLFKPTRHQHACDVCGNLLQLLDEWINGLSAWLRHWSNMTSVESLCACVCVWQAGWVVAVIFED